MNDTELDEILNQWSAPSAPPSMRRRVLGGFPAFPPRKLRWNKGVVAAVMLAAAAFFLLVTQALPQRPAPIPWSVDSEFVRYADDGSTSIEMYSTSYESNGTEILLSRSMPGNPFKTVLMDGLDVTLPRPFQTAYARSGCSAAGNGGKDGADEAGPATGLLVPHRV